MKNIKTICSVFATVLSILLVLSGCAKSNASSTADSISEGANNSITLNTDDMFTNRDFETDYEESDAQTITVSDSNSKVNITKAGTYVISGTVSDGMIIVDVPDTDKVQIVLNGASVVSKTSAALYVKSADKVFVTTVKGTENTLANGGTFTAIDDSNIDGAVFSKSDITFNGEGTLTVTSPSGHGIVCKDDIKFTGGTYSVTCASHGIDANDSIRISNGVFDITSGKDGMHCENNDNNEKGYIYIQSGTFVIKSDDDGIHANTYIIIEGGKFDITAAEGLEATCIKIDDGTIHIEASDDGINAAKNSTVTTPVVEINGGEITVVMGKGDTDGVDSNGDIIINGGTVSVTGNSSFDYDGKGVINGGTVIVNGTEVTTLPNQIMGGPGGMRDNAVKTPNDTITSATPNADGNQETQRPQMPGPDNSGSVREQRPDGNFGRGPAPVQNGGQTTDNTKPDKSA